MIPQENCVTYHQDNSMYQMGKESTQSETIQPTDDERSADHQPTELVHDDADRRILHESEADEDDD